MLLLEIRTLIQKVAPDATEIIEYGMLGYMDLCNLAAQKHYVSLYVSPEILANYKEKHPQANCGKSCLRIRSIAQLDREAMTELLTKVNEARLSGDNTSCC